MNDDLTPAVHRNRLIDRLEWAVKCALERPSNYDKRVSVHADDIRALIQEAQRD